MNRVVVTGLGVVSPVGNDVESFWHALCTGTCGIGSITRFDTTDFKVKIAGEVRNFDPKQYMDKLDILHSDIYTQFAMAAACQAMSDSRLARSPPSASASTSAPASAALPRLWPNTRSCSNGARGACPRSSSP